MRTFAATLIRVTEKMSKYDYVQKHHIIYIMIDSLVSTPIYLLI